MPSRSYRPLFARLLFCAAHVAQADYANGPDPYAPGFGFGDPQIVPCGTWSRGTAPPTRWPARRVACPVSSAGDA
jgi:hypothetical protein